MARFSHPLIDIVSVHSVEAAVGNDNEGFELPPGQTDMDNDDIISMFDEYGGAIYDMHVRALTQRGAKMRASSLVDRKTGYEPDRVESIMSEQIGTGTYMVTVGVMK